MSTASLRRSGAGASSAWASTRRKLILEIYDALRRPGAGDVLEALAREVEDAYGAAVTAAFLREAAALQR